MKIREVLNILKMQKTFGKTMCGRPITKIAIENIDATLADEKNYDYDAVKCENCCIIMSGLLVPDGCVNCGLKGGQKEITAKDIS
jgi:hypothetical protein